MTLDQLLQLAGISGFAKVKDLLRIKLWPPFGSAILPPLSCFGPLFEGLWLGTPEEGEVPNPVDYLECHNRVHVQKTEKSSRLTAREDQQYREEAALRFAISKFFLEQIYAELLIAEDSTELRRVQPGQWKKGQEAKGHKCKAFTPGFAPKAVKGRNSADRFQGHQYKPLKKPKNKNP